MVTTSCGVIQPDGELTAEEVRNVSQLAATAVAIGTIANGAPIFRDDQGKGSMICDLLADPANADSILGLLATNGLCDVFTLATGQPVPVARPQ